MSQVWLVTGPNMGGKSTFLRQNALIVIMAQIGAFVPAQEARIGIVDSLFCRVGAADELAADRSTFMVEMVEAAAILHRATPRSLVIVDELGRGTAARDGLALAWAALEALHAAACRTLFATHYRELAALAPLPGVQCHSTEVREEAAALLFSHRLTPGVARASYGLHVAALAGVPAPVIQRARALLALLERRDADASPAAEQIVRAVRPLIPYFTHCHAPSTSQ